MFVDLWTQIKTKSETEFLSYTVPKSVCLRPIDFYNLLIYYWYEIWRHAVAEWLRHYATNRKTAESIPDKMIFLIYLILPSALGPGVYSGSNTNEYQKQKNNNVSAE
jgi:hypothetical protein